MLKEKAVERREYVGVWDDAMSAEDSSCSRAQAPRVQRGGNGSKESHKVQRKESLEAENVEDLRLK